MLPIMSAVSGSRCLLQRCIGRTAAAWDTVKGTASLYTLQRLLARQNSAPTGVVGALGLESYADCGAARDSGCSLKYVSERHSHSTGPSLKRFIQACDSSTCTT